MAVIPDGSAQEQAAVFSDSVKILKHLHSLVLFIFTVGTLSLEVQAAQRVKKTVGRAVPRTAHVLQYGTLFALASQAMPVDTQILNITPN